MDFVVREMADTDRRAWVEMRTALWPQDTGQTHAEAISALLNIGEYWGLIAENADGKAVGFAEVAVRKYVNGCDTQPVGFLEGIWVAPRYRRQKIGALLIRHAEALLLARGLREFGSDTEIDNQESQAAHQGWGFSETERVVYFRKLLHARQS